MVSVGKEEAVLVRSLRSQSALAEVHNVSDVKAREQSANVVSQWGTALITERSDVFPAGHVARAMTACSWQRTSFPRFALNESIVISQPC